MLETGVPFFVALPDTEAGRAVARHALLRGPDLQVHRHPSGRPWLIGRPTQGRLRIVRAGASAVAVVGLHEGDGRRLERALSTLPDEDAFVAEVSRLAGDYHVVAADGPNLLARGSAYGLRRIYHAEVGGCVVAADRAVVLARLTGAELDDRALALHLLGAWTHALSRRPMWHGVRAVRPGEYLTVSGHGTPRHRTWHRVPDPDVPLAEGARRVREEMLTAIGLRTAGGGTISADMSGGLDSTSVACTAARLIGDGELIVTSGGDHDDSEDLRWARRAAAHLPRVEHDIFSGPEMPLFFSNLLDPGDAFDQPSDVPICRERAGAAHRRMAARGSRLHLSGIGGDHLFLGLPAHYHHLVRHRPLASLHQLRGYRVMFSWRWRDLARALLDRASYADALRSVRVDPGTEIDQLGTGRFGWFFPPSCPPWITDDARAMIADELRAVAATAEPLGLSRGTHLERDHLLSSGPHVLAREDTALRMGIRVETPYLDDRVIDAALSVRVQDRTTPYAYKRLLAEAMRGIVPQEITERRNKLSGNQAHQAGLRRHRAEIAAVWESSALAAHGLVDEATLHRMSSNPNSREFGGHPPDLALNVEAWLRTATSPQKVSM